MVRRGFSRLWRRGGRAGNLMEMRHAAMMLGDMSSKMERVIEIVKEAEDNGRRVVVFSTSAKYSTEVARALPDRCSGR